MWVLGIKNPDWYGVINQQLNTYMLAHFGQKVNTFLLKRELGLSTKLSKGVNVACATLLLYHYFFFFLLRPHPPAIVLLPIIYSDQILDIQHPSGLPFDARQ